MSEPNQNSLFTTDELHQWQLALAEADRHNILCHCRRCDRQWIASAPSTCECGSTNIEAIACWQFPDD